MPDAYVTQDDLETFMEQAIDDDLAALTLNAAMASVRKFLNQEITFHAEDVVELDGTGKDSLLLPERPVRRLVSVIEDDSEVLPADTLLRDGIIYKRSNWSRWGGTWRFGRGNCVVTYDHGWDVLDETSSGDFDPEYQVPADIVLATLGIARRAHAAAGEFVDGVLSGENIGNYSYTLAQATSEAVTEASTLLMGEKMILEQYKAKRVA